MSGFDPYFHLISWIRLESIMFFLFTVSKPKIVLYSVILGALKEITRIIMSILFPGHQGMAFILFL